MSDVGRLLRSVARVTGAAGAALRRARRSAASLAMAGTLVGLLSLVEGFATAPTAAATPPPEMRVARTTPVYAHMFEPSAAEIQLRMDDGWATGAFIYYPERVNAPFGWTAEWEELAKAFPDGIDLFVSPKVFTTASLTHWCEQLSPAQRERTVFAYWQEPESAFTTDEERAEFREQVEKAAAIVQPYGIRNGIHLMAWTLNDQNPADWAGTANFKKFIPEDTSAVDVVGISLFDYHQNFSGPDQLKPVTKLLARELPDAEWGPVATGWSVPVGTPLQDPIRLERAAAAADAFAYADDHGAAAYGWFDFNPWEDKDYGVTGDPALLEVLRDL